MDKIYDVCIIGAGWSGLMACKYMKQNNLSVILLEKRDAIGGVWKYSDNPDITTVSRNTHTTSSKSFTEMSDYPMPKSYSSFPHHTQIYEYLVNYSKHFKLNKHIKLNTTVKQIKKINNIWNTVCDNRIYKSKKLILTTGVHSKKNYPDKKIFDNFTGKIIHSQTYKKLTKKYYNKNVLIYGGGETASDIANEIPIYTKKTYWAIPNGQWFLPKIQSISPKGIDTHEPADHHTSALNMFVHPVSKNGGVYLYEDVVEYIWGKCGHGVKEWKSDAKYQRQFLNKSSEVLYRVAVGQIIPKKKIIKCNKKTITFDDKSKEKFDIIILSTGYKVIFPFLEEKSRSKLNDNYKYLISNKDPSIAYIGFVRPVIGSIPAIAEVQSMYVGKLFSNKVKLPIKKEMMQIIKKDKIFWKNYFKDTSGRLNTLVNIYIYSSDIAGACKQNPNYLKLLFKSPKKWWKAITCPYNNSRYLINDNKYHDIIFKNIKQYEPEYFNTRFILIYFLYFVAFLIKPLYDFSKFILRGEDGSLIQLSKKEKIKQKRKVLKKFNLIIIGIIFLINLPQFKKHLKKIYINYISIILIIISFILLSIR